MLWVKRIALVVMICWTCYLFSVGPASLPNALLILFTDLNRDAGWRKSVESPLFHSALFLAWLPTLLYFIKQKRYRIYSTVFISLLPILCAFLFDGNFAAHSSFMGEGFELPLLLTLVTCFLIPCRVHLFNETPKD